MAVYVLEGHSRFLMCITPVAYSVDYGVVMDTVMITQSFQVPLDATLPLPILSKRTHIRNAELGNSFPGRENRIRWIPAFASMTVVMQWSELRREMMGMEREHIARKSKPCPATKRNGEVCGSIRVSASGYCFAHDPESAEWRAMGGRASNKRKRAVKQLKEAGMGHLLDALEETLEELRSGEGDPSSARAKARVAETIWRIVNGADDEAKADSAARWPTKWDLY